METQHPGSMKILPAELRRRFFAPCKWVTFYGHLLGGIVFLGGAGIWFALVKPTRSVEETTTALLGYFASLVGAALLEFSADDQPYMRSFGTTAAIILIFSALLLVWFSGVVVQLLVAIVWSLFGLAYWWVANGTNPRFIDVNPVSAIGGDSSAELQTSSDQGWSK